eukprot:1157778-Pelagomonas_calceolata.AAC.14
MHTGRGQISLRASHKQTGFRPASRVASKSSWVLITHTTGTNQPVVSKGCVQACHLSIQGAAPNTCPTQA